MGRIVGSIAAALVVAAAVTMCAAEPGRAESSAAIMLQNAPITAGDAEKSGTHTAASALRSERGEIRRSGHADAGAPDPRATPTPTPTATPTPPAQVKIDGVRTDRVPTPGQLLFKSTRDITFMDPLSWSVNIFKKRHQLVVYYKGRMFKNYHAVFGRSFEPGTKLWEGDRRTPEGVYTIVEKHPSRRWDWFLTLNYPNAA